MKRLVAKFLRAVRRRRRADAFVLFVPWDQKGDDDAVRHLAPVLIPKLRREFPHDVLSNWNTHFAEILKARKLQRNYRTVVLFAHPSTNGRGFAVTPGDQRVLLPRWWHKEAERPYRLLYAHVCGGSGILREGGWNQVFSGWISYHQPIGIFLDTPAAREGWVTCLRQILDAVSASHKIESTRHQIAAIYHRCQADAINMADDSPGDLINLALFEDARQALISSDQKTFFRR
jgi:hypothetical protein